MVSALSVNILYDKTVNNKDVEIIELLLKKIRTIKNVSISKARHVDFREPNVHCDIQFHIGTPIFVAVPWAHTNIMVVDSEQWNPVYSSYLHAFDAVIYKDSLTYDTCKTDLATNVVFCSSWREDGLTGAFMSIFDTVKELVDKRRPAKGVFHCPPVIQQDDCPPITIVTPTYNRRKLIDIAFHNILATDYPLEKIEWVVVEDNEDSTKMATDLVVSFQIKVPQVKIKYIPLQGNFSIGQKRNVGIEHATNDIILFMDDDDHYPSTSFRRRVAWLLKGSKCGITGGADIACCTTLALYDLKRGVSAVNVPPWNIPLSQRISEATLTFKKSAWESRKFQDVSISEGEGWIDGRESQVIEIPPQQIIVAFSHGENKSSRRIPPTENPPGCFWGFPKEYLIFIHGLAGVTVEDASATKKSDKKSDKK